MLFSEMSQHYGTTGWWPGDSEWEIMAGAVLTQHTSWRNVVLSLGRLKASGFLDFQRFTSVSLSDISSLIRPSGFPLRKARTLKELGDMFISRGYIPGEPHSDNSHITRDALLSVYGIGEETASVIELYCFHRPVLVVDLYYRRLFGRYFRHPPLPADIIRALDSALLSELHALIVLTCKDFCRKKPLCDICYLGNGCGRYHEGTI